LGDLETGAFDDVAEEEFREDVEDLGHGVMMARGVDRDC
jgi:hypothetical protein